MKIAACIFALGFGLVATPALADPCQAIPDKGGMPNNLSHGTRFSGSVVYIIDGDSLCVEVASGPGGWVEVRLSDVYAPRVASLAARRRKPPLSAPPTASVRTVSRV